MIHTMVVVRETRPVILIVLGSISGSWKEKIVLVTQDAVDMKMIGPVVRN